MPLKKLAPKKEQESQVKSAMAKIKAGNEQIAKQHDEHMSDHIDKWSCLQKGWTKKFSPHQKQIEPGGKQD
jgi:hypothetical protein